MTVVQMSFALEYDQTVRVLDFCPIVAERYDSISSEVCNLSRAATPILLKIAVQLIAPGKLSYFADPPRPVVAAHHHIQ
jgi:hypothetical protein